MMCSGSAWVSRSRRAAYPALAFPVASSAVRRWAASVAWLSSRSSRAAWSSGPDWASASWSAPGLFPAGTTLSSARTRLCPPGTDEPSAETSSFPARTRSSPRRTRPCSPAAGLFPAKTRLRAPETIRGRPDARFVPGENKNIFHGFELCACALMLFASEQCYVIGEGYRSGRVSSRSPAPGFSRRRYCAA